MDTIKLLVSNMTGKFVILSAYSIKILKSREQIIEPKTAS